MKVKPKRDLQYSIGTYRPSFFPSFSGRQERFSVPNKIYDTFDVVIKTDGLTYTQIIEFKIRFKGYELKCNPDDFEIVERGLYVL